MIIAIVLLVHVFLADCLWRDIGKLQERGRTPWPCGKLGWAGVTLVFGLFAVGTYWLMHHSSFAPDHRIPLGRSGPRPN